jgi:glycosyltransferase involved in cell wall biosynthesis
MPAYNCEAYIAKSIESVLEQSYPCWELLIGDDASTDRTYEITQSFVDPRIRVYRNFENLGNIVTRNNLSALAGGEFLSILDADDYMSNTRLEEQTNAFKNDNELKACFTNYFEVDTNGKSVVKRELKENYVLDKTNFENSFYSMPATIMIRREVYQQVGGLHLYFDRLFGEDKYWVYCILEQFKALMLKSPLYYYRANPFSLTNLLDNPRKLTAVELVNELIRQRKRSGRDWLSEGRLTEALEYESQLMRNSQWLGEQYRIFAARQIDLSKRRESSNLLKMAFNTNPFNFSIVRTALYFFRKFYF